MEKETFLNIEIEPAPIELELSVEMRCREILASDNFDDIKRYCTHLVRYQMKQDVIFASMLGRLVELETIIAKKEMTEERRTMDRIKKFFHN
jgi:hypothetical protein|tara:strand:+ start:222 stop:497 length:276 start_codon:yes stop_codon:yes gene_type:complete